MNTGEFHAKEGSRFSEADAKVIGPALSRLGVFGASKTVEAARSGQEVELRPYFDWDNEHAAEEHRRQQAREMNRAIVFHDVSVPGAPPQEIRSFYAVPRGLALPEDTEDEQDEEEKSGKVYVPLAMVQARPELAAQVIQDALRQLKGWSKRYSQYRRQFPAFERKLGKLFDTIEELDEAAG